MRKRSKMALKIPPPVFSKEKSYQRWKDEIEAWKAVSNVSKDQQALVIAKPWKLPWHCGWLGRILGARGTMLKACENIGGQLRDA